MFWDYTTSYTVFTGCKTSVTIGKVNVIIIRRHVAQSKLIDDLQTDYPWPCKQSDRWARVFRCNGYVTFNCS